MRLLALAVPEVVPLAAVQESLMVGPL